MLNGSMSQIKHRVAFGVLVDGDRALLCHRHPERKLFPDVWDLPGGHIEADETPSETVRRELREELGIEVTAMAGLATFVDVPGAETHAFVVTRWQGEPVNLAPDEHDELRWVTSDLLPDRLAIPELAALVLEALAAVEP